MIGSGIAAQHLSPGDVGLELFENAAATGAGLFAIILMFGPVSGGHFNPVVSFVDASFGGMSWREAIAYAPAQIVGCITGAIVANAMFAQALVTTRRDADPLPCSREEWLVSYGYFVTRRPSRMALARTPSAA